MIRTLLDAQIGASQQCVEGFRCGIRALYGAVDAARHELFGEENLAIGFDAEGLQRGGQRLRRDIELCAVFGDLGTGSRDRRQHERGGSRQQECALDGAECHFAKHRPPFTAHSESAPIYELRRGRTRRPQMQSCNRCFTGETLRMRSVQRAVAAGF